MQATFLHGPEGLTVELTGDLGADFEGAEVLQAISGPAVSFDLHGLRRIDSTGVRSWLRFMSAIKPGVSISLVRCAPSFVLQANAIQNFLDRAVIRSFAVPLICTACETSRTEYFEAADVHPPELPALAPCTACGGEMEADVDPGSYLAFLRSR